MRRPAAVFTIVLALGATILLPSAGARADGREEGPTEIEKCQTISKPGAYKLVNNLTAASGANCLDITVSFVTIDLAGFTISGSISGATVSGAAIVAEPTSIGGIALGGIAVRNGSIDTSNFQAAVNFGFAGASIVEGLRVAGGRLPVATNQPGPAITANGIVRGNIVVDYGGGAGAFVGAGAISAFGTVTGNFVINNRSGIAIGQGSTVIGNTALDNIQFGLNVSCPSNVTNNTAVNNAGQNLVLNGNGCNDTNNVAP
jgi:hypothetical protein